MQKTQSFCLAGRQNIAWLLLLMFVASLWLDACQPKETELPFETIEQWNLGAGHEDKESVVIVGSDAADVEELEDLITPTKLDQLRALNWDTHFVLAIFQGWKPSTGYKAQIQRITRQGDTVTIYAQFQDPKPDEETSDVATSPYHLVQVQKVGTWKQDIAFNLVVNRTIVATSFHHIP